MSSQRSVLEKLHEQLTLILLERIKEGDSTPALLSVARQFLKDNGIESLPTPGSHMSALFDNIQSYDLDDAH
ncbi:MAG: hypothetical protein J0G29_02425 [Alphaproteobacteria bacterium]|nr:hypothetical protein [Alphaproteobacteria bacterium]OJV45471.1 MAG: hypothetical protein BGO28_05085 [Alphaproteobacteria bacterium 43-37]